IPFKQFSLMADFSRTLVIQNVKTFWQTTTDMWKNGGFWKGLANTDAYSKKSTFEFSLQPGQEKAFVFTNGYFDDAVIAINIIYLVMDNLDNIVSSIIGNSALDTDLTMEFLKYMVNENRLNLVNYKIWFDNQSYNLIQEDITKQLTKWLDINKLIDPNETFLSKTIAKKVEESILKSFDLVAETIFKKFKYSIKAIKIANNLVLSSSPRFAAAIPIDFDNDVDFPPYPINPNPIMITLANVKEFTFSWKVENPEIKGLRYNIYLGTESDRLTLIAENISSTSFTYKQLLPNRRYYWQVIVRNESGYRTNGAIWSFDNGQEVVIPTVSTIGISNLTHIQATTGGDVVSQGGSPVTERGICWSTSPNPTIESNTISGGNGTGFFSITLEDLQQETTYFVRAYATNFFGTGYGEEISFITRDESFTLPIVMTGHVIDIRSNQVTIMNNFVNTINDIPVLQKGVVYSTHSNLSIDTDPIYPAGDGAGGFDATIGFLKPNTKYYAAAFAIANSSTAYGNEISFTTKEESTASGLWPEGYVHCNVTPTEVVDVTNPVTGRTWMDRNLGASRAANSSTDELAYGDLYQWGRFADGHQCRNSGTTSILSSTDQPNTSNFILINDWPQNWRTPDNPNLWQGVNGINNPCPLDYRLPTEQELNNEHNSWNNKNSSGTFSSALKLPSSGIRSHENGGGIFTGAGVGAFWSSSTANGNGTAIVLGFNAVSSGVDSGYPQANGFTVRCIKD
ncbi:hypothetical protein ACFFF3_13360, partial [Mongoliitalea lutea]